MAEGLRNAEIAGRLFLSEKTVAHHVSAILRKLGVATRSQAGCRGRAARASSKDRQSSRCRAGADVRRRVPVNP